ncbi:hypothetical protein NDA13_004066 [Ustilago tritici]|nr:hypothetical protein NDA13_004066 [Ustilago tritici]
MSRSTQEAMQAALHIVKYLNQTRDDILQIGGPETNENAIKAYTDASWALDPNTDWKSTSGSAVKVFGSTVTWNLHVHACFSSTVLARWKMAGSTSKAELAAPTVKGASEIDVIFSSASSRPVGLSSIGEEGRKEEGRKDKRQAEVPDRGEAKKKKKNKQGKHKEPAAQEAHASSSSTSTRAKCKPNCKLDSVQVVTDTSHTIPTSTRASGASGAPPKSRPPNAQTTADDLDRFTDSRATSARKRTEDGLRIFTAAELRLGEGSGGTPDCPFDCQCCF